VGWPMGGGGSAIGGALNCWDADSYISMKSELVPRRAVS
jgi:hypothetical protein